MNDLMVTLNHPKQVFYLLSHIYSVFWYQILNVIELVLKEFNKIIKWQLTLIVVLYITDLDIIILSPVIHSVIRLVYIIQLIPYQPYLLEDLVEIKPE